MALHEQSVGATDEWYTPSYIFEALGCQFDLDVASPGASIVPWIPAALHLTPLEHGLAQDWPGFIWMNPPFGRRNGLVPWLSKFFAREGGGIALVPDRTSAPWWQRYVSKADQVLFVSPKIRFLDWQGREGVAPAQGTCLLGVGERAVEALDRAENEKLGVNFRRVRPQ